VQACPEFPWHVFGEFLYLEPRNTDVAFAIPVVAGIPSGPTGVVNPGYTPAFRIGFTRDLYDATSNMGVSWTRFTSSTNDAITAPAGGSIVSLVLPNAPVFPAYPSVSASYNINYDLVDLDYRGLFISSNRYTVNFLLGARYAQLTQDFGATFGTSLPAHDVLNTDIDFSGCGIRVGLEGERYAARSGLMVYGRTAASFLAGRFNAYYTDTGAQGPINGGLVADRVVPILELELGVGWVSPSKHFRIYAGYLFNAWYNVMDTSDFINAAAGAAKAGTFNAATPSDTITFDGLVIHGEVLF
jgi:hypothetical protein